MLILDEENGQSWQRKAHGKLSDNSSSQERTKQTTYHCTGKGSKG